MTIIYALIARGSNTILAEYTDSSGNFPQITLTLLSKFPMDKDSKMSYVYDEFVFHYIVLEGIIYLAMCDGTSKDLRRIPFSFLEDVVAKFKASYGDRAKTAKAFAMNR